MIHTSCSPTQTLMYINHPHLSNPPSFVITIQYTIDMVFLGQMRQSYKSGSVRNHEIISLHLGSCVPFSQDPLPPARHQLQLFVPSAQTINQEKKKNPEMRSNFQTNHIILSRPTYTELRAKRGRFGSQP